MNQASSNIMYLASLISKKARVGDILTQLKSNYLTPALHSNDAVEPLKLHATTSPWVTYGYIMHYTAEFNNIVRELRERGIPEKDANTQYLTPPTEPTTRP